MRSSTALSICLLMSATPLIAHAELMIGGYPPGTSSAHPLRQFAATAQGSASPIREIGGPATGLDGPASASFEPSENLLYVSDFWGQAIRVFPAYASGDVAPLRVINPPILGQTRSNVPIVAQDELVAIASNCCIYTFPLHADGDAVVRIRSISWGGGPGSPTQLNNPLALTWLPGSDELAVVDYDFDPPYASKVVFHARTADGQATPTRVLKSIHTANAAGLAHDPIQHKLYLLTSTTDDSVNFVAQIRVFADTAANADAPLYTIEGAATQLDFTSIQYPSGIGIDQDLQRVMVGISANGNPADNRVVSFALSASGNAAPVQVLSGSTLSPGSIGTPFAMPTAVIFASGFDN